MTNKIPTNIIPISPLLRPLPEASELGRPGMCVLTDDGLILTEGEAIRREMEQQRLRAARVFAMRARQHAA